MRAVPLETPSDKMNPKNILPRDGFSYLVDDADSEFDWPEIAAHLAATMPWKIETARIFGREIQVPRMTAWFGCADYTYSGVRHRAAGFPAIVQRLRERAEALSERSFNSVLLNMYRDGRDSVGWHSDNEASLGDCPTIASLSLGATRRFNFDIGERRKRSRLNLERGIGWLWGEKPNAVGFTRRQKRLPWSNVASISLSGG